jgi:purine-binding chemotaxis protein CheW
MSTITAETIRSTDATSLSTYSDMQLVTFTLGNEEYGVDINKVREIIRLVEITKVPKAPAFVEGLINLRGSVVPIVDLRKRFEIPSTNDRNRMRIMVVDVNSKTIGVIVDSVSEVLLLPAENIQDVPTTVSSDVDGRFLQAVGKVNDKLMQLLDLDRIFNAEEMSKITKG